MVGEAELYRRFAHRIRAYGLRHLGDDAAADDLVQQVLLVAIDSLRAGKVREPAELASFMLGTARMTVLALRSGQARHQRLERRWLAPAESVEPSVVLDLERLRDCLGGLSHKERTVVLLSFYAERDGDDIAAELRTSPGNVRVIRHRAVERLQDCMGVDA